MKGLRIITSILILLLEVEVKAQEVAFVAKVFEHGDISLPYREAVFNTEASSSAALVILLHSRHSCGSNNDAHKTAEGVYNICKYLLSQSDKAIFLVPQCSEGREWNERYPRGNGSMTEAIKALADKYITKGSADAKRVYILGASMGGSGVWRLLGDYPTFFAAALTAASNPRNVSIAKLTQTPLLAVSGELDRMVDAEDVKSLIADINANGGTAKFRLLIGRNHGETCQQAFSSDNLRWLLSHTRQ